MKKPATWLTVSLIALALTACTNDGGTEEDGAPDTATGTQKVVEVTDQQGVVEGFVGAVEDTEITSCERAGSGWTNTGYITNPTEETQDYRVYVSFMSKGDTLGLIQVDVPGVAAGATESWRVEADLAAENLECVLRVERFAPQG